MYMLLLLLSCFSRVRLCVTLWTTDHLAPLSMGFSRQEYWSGLLCPPPGSLPNQGIESVSLTSPVLVGRFYHLVPPGKPLIGSGGGGVVTKLCPTLVTPWTVACQVPLSMGFSRQEYWSGLPFPSPAWL